MQNFRPFGRGSSPLPRLAFIGALMLPLAACDIDNLLELPDPDVVDPRVFTDSTALPAFRASAYRNFAFAYTNSQDAQIQYSGMLADEFVNVETFDTRIEIDMRDMRESNSSLDGATRRLYRARSLALDAIDAYHRFSPNRAGISEAFSLLSYTYTMFGENYCSGVPFSRLNAEGQFEFGGQESTEQIHTRALVAADSALAAATRASASANITNLARIARGRALLNLNRPADAAAAVAAVPTTFNFEITHSTNTAAENNGVYLFNTINRRISPAHNEGINGLPFRDTDPRTPVNPTARAGFSGDPMYDQLKYPSREAPTPLATGVEARLIEAEAALLAGGDWLGILNALRASPPATSFPASRYPGIGTLAPLTDPGTPAARVDLLFKERAYWMWMTSHRLGDLRRLIRQYGRNPESVFPTGAYWRGGTYGTDVNFPLNVDERNNPEFENFPAGNLCEHRNA